MKPPIENIKRIRKSKNLSREFVAEKLGLNESTYGKVERGETGLTIERLYELAEVFNMPPEDILTFSKASKRGNVKYVPVEFQAGFLSGHCEKEHIEGYKSFNLPFIDGTENYMVNADGDSLYPTISHDDRIIIERVFDVADIKYGKIYAVVATEGKVLKRIYSHHSYNDKVILKSDNVIYEPYEIYKQDIITIWKVKGSFDVNLSPKNPFVFAENFNPQLYKNLSQK